MEIRLPKRVQCWKVRVKHAWYEDESVSSSVSRENNVCNDAFHVIGLYGSGDKISLFLKDLELARVALSCHIALDILCQEMHEARSNPSIFVTV